jgi:uncharacterized protein involved in exopolysaccharide biosynthesis
MSTMAVVMNIIRAIRADSRPLATFIRVFALVFGGALICSAIVAYFSPKVYSSTVQIRVEKDHSEVSADYYFPLTQFKIIKSYRILTNVIANLHLDEKLARQHGADRWTIDDTFDDLVHSLSIRQSRMSNLVDISVTNNDPELAASIANATADSYKLFRLEQWKDSQERESGFPVSVCNAARPDRDSCMQTELRIFTMWVLGGTLLALLAGVWSALGAAHRSAR